jgi:transglutaminase-like putative cysteine protease
MLVDVLEPAYSPPPYASAAVNGAPRYYWRATTYDRYDGAGWSSRSTKKVKYTAEQPIFSELPVFQEMIRQRVTPVRPLGGVLLATGALQSANAPYQIDWRATPGSFTDADQFGALIADGPYEALSLLPKVSAGQLRAASTDYPDWVLQYYLQLPDNLPFRVRELAIEITANQDNPYDKAKAIEGFLRTIPYSLDTPAPPRGVDVVDHFLFTLQTGFCDHYASSMVVLARSAGLPARMVIGFASGNYNPEKHQYVVREANSHAWAEVFFTGIGWVEFEPTANQTAIIRAEDSQRSLPILAIELPATEPQPTISLAERLKGYVMLALPGLLCLAALSVQAFFLIRAIEMWWWSRKPPRQAIHVVYERMRRHARHTFGFIPGGDTPDEFAAHLQSLLLAASQGLPLRKQFEKRFAPAGDEIQQLTHLYTYAAYSDHPITPDGRKAALQAWRKLRGRLWLARLLQKGTKRQ